MTRDLKDLKVLGMSDTYWRIHWDGCDATGTRAFTADNAWSRPWGGEPVDGDPSVWTCVACDGTGTGTYDPLTESTRCASCDGQGIRDADRGYSAVTFPAQLLDATPGEAWEREHADVPVVVEFEGELVGYGLDGEPLVVPTRVIRWMTWTQLTRLIEGLA